MAVSSIISRVYDLNKPLVMESLDHLLVMGDDKGDQFNIAVVNGSNAKDLIQGSVIGYFIKVEPGKKIEDCDTVTIFGSSKDNIATVVLPESCYVVPCRFVLTIKVSLENTRHAVYIAEGAVARSSTSHLIDPGHNIPDIEELLALIAKIESAANAASEATKKADSATTSANNAAKKATEAAEYIENVTVEGVDLATGIPAYAEKSNVNGHLHIEFGLPMGKTGPQGPPGTIENFSIELQGDVTGYATGETGAVVVDTRLKDIFESSFVEVTPFAGGKSEEDYQTSFGESLAIPSMFFDRQGRLVSYGLRTFYLPVVDAWRPGDVLTIRSIPVYGLVTTSTTTIYLNFNAGKPILASNIKITTFNGGIRSSSGGYIDGLGDSTTWIDMSDYEIRVDENLSFISTNGKSGNLRLAVRKINGPFENVLNNTPVCFYASNLTLAFS